MLKLNKYLKSMTKLMNYCGYKFKECSSFKKNYGMVNFENLYFVENFNLQLLVEKLYLIRMNVLF